MRYKANGFYRKQYSTKANDTFDKIAFELYGNEMIASYLIEANPEYSDTLIFREGVLLNLPKLEQIETSTLPQWKGGL
jgi:phage tail protein X